MTYRWQTVFLICGFLAFFGACKEGSSNKQTLDPVLQSNEQLQENREAAFLLDSYSYGLILEQYTELAVEKSTTPTVKSFAENSLAYHRKLKQELAGLAAARQVKLPEQAGQDVQDYKQELAALPAAEFEKRYLQVLSDVQTKMIARYETAADGELDTHLTDWSLQTLPQLRAHAQAVAELSKQQE
jgi:putative membrane protein